MAYIKLAAGGNGNVYDGVLFPSSIPATDSQARQFVWVVLATTDENDPFPGDPRVYYTDPNTLVQTELEVDVTEMYSTSVVWNGVVFVVFRMVELGMRGQEWTELGIEGVGSYDLLDGNYFYVDSREDDDSYIPTETRQEVFNSVEDTAADTEWNLEEFNEWAGYLDVGVPARSNSGTIGYFAFGSYGDNGVNSGYADQGYDDSPPAYFGGPGVGPGFAEFPPSTAGRSSNFDALLHLHPSATSYSALGTIFEFAAVPAPAPGVVSLLPRSRQVKLEELPFVVKSSQLG